MDFTESSKVMNAIDQIALITEHEAKATEEISTKINTLNEHLDNTKKLTITTGKSVYSAG